MSIRSKTGLFTLTVLKVRAEVGSESEGCNDCIYSCNKCFDCSMCNDIPRH